MCFRRSGFKRLLLALLLPAFSAQAGECISLKKIDIDEQELMSPATRQQLFQPFIDACIDAQLIRRLLTQISDFYIAEGYVTTRPYLLEQDLQDGQIEVRVLKGRIEAIVDADSGQSNSRIGSAFAFHDDWLNLRQLESALETLQRPPSVTASFEILPGGEQGSSIVEIEFEESRALSVELGASAQTGLDPAFSLQASLDNPFDINDILTFRSNTGSLREAYQSNRGSELNYSFALAANLIELGYSELEYRQRVQGINDSYLSRGESRVSRISLNRQVLRRQRHSLNLVITLQQKNSRSFFDDVLIEVSSYATTQLQASLRHSWLQPWVQLTTSYAYHQGLDSLGARDDDYYTPESGFENPARLQFSKIIIDSMLQYYFDDPAYLASLNLNLQHSDDILFNDDQLSLGSQYTVRGYASALSGSNGGYLRGEVTRVMQTPGGGKRFTLSLGLDYGEVACEIDNHSVCGSIYGTAIGLGLSDANFNGKLLWGHPLKKISADVGDKDQFTLDLSWKF